MVFRIKTNYEACMLVVKISTPRPEKICLMVKDATQPNTVFQDRYTTKQGEFTLIVRMPVVGERCLIYIYNERNGNKELGQDNTFTVESIDKVPLERKLDVIDFSDPNIKSFIEFCTRFCYNAGILPANTYVSDDGKFRIEYLPVITSNKDGRVLETPARISKSNGRIQVARSKFIKMTVPERFAILCHEFSHFYKNENINDEIEADLNGLLIYLGLGYPRIEAYYAFIDTFVNTPTEMNRKRTEVLNRFIRDFENANYVMKEKD